MNIRILSYNIHKGGEKKKEPAKIQLIQNQIIELGSEIILLQEVRGHQCELLKHDFLPHYSYGQNALNKSGSHGNLIISKHPIIYSDNIDISMHRFERRGLLHCLIKPEQASFPIHLFCTHLGLFVKDRAKQLNAIAKYINENVASGEPVILGGDFNDWGDHAGNLLIQEMQFSEAFLNIHNSYAKTFPAFMPALKLDRIYFRGFNVNFATRLDDKAWKYLSDHIALEVSLTLR